LRTVARSHWILEKILQVVASAERVSCTVPEHNAHAVVFCCVVKEIRHGDVHGGRHRIFLGRSIELNSQDTSGTFGNNVTHLPPPVAADSKVETCGIVPLTRMPAISSLVNPSSFSTSSLCSPIPGARLAGTLVTPCTWIGLLMVEGNFSPAPSSGTTMSFARSCGSLTTSCGSRTAPKGT